MLQQTQVARVLPKFAAFVARFPHYAALAEAPLSDVLAQWNGLGYNRRAKFLWEAAKIVVSRHGGALPCTLEDLVSLPGIGPNTAGAILAYAFDRPVVFIETNIRTVVIHHFFADGDQKVTDAQIRDVVRQTLPPDTPRDWYWALMDYGTHLKATTGAQLQRAHGYKRQSSFQGSRRQLRGQVLRSLLTGGKTTASLQAAVADARLTEVLALLRKEGMVSCAGELWHLTGSEG
jgi:A/G-specific adenine glycosylase